MSIGQFFGIIMSTNTSFCAFSRGRGFYPAGRRLLLHSVFKYITFIDRKNKTPRYQQPVAMFSVLVRVTERILCGSTRLSGSLATLLFIANDLTERVPATTLTFVLPQAAISNLGPLSCRLSDQAIKLSPCH
jgi:hypothetical protein